MVAYPLAQRTREIGVRMALAAQLRDVLRLVLKEAMTLVALGLALGWLAGAALARLLSNFLFGISTLDAVTFATIPVVLTLVSLLASYLPARRAARVDPLLALRCD